MFKSVGAAAFLAAWRGLSEVSPSSGYQLPHYRHAFQQLAAELLPWMAIVEEVTRGEYVIRFLGTARVEMWGQDLTGTNPFSLMSPGLVLAARRNMEVVLAHPCGMVHMAHYAVPSGREVHMENVTVPVGNDPGLPRRLVNYVTEIATTGYSESTGEVRSVSHRAWLDIGAGVPKKAPAK